MCSSTASKNLILNLVSPRLEHCCLMIQLFSLLQFFTDYLIFESLVILNALKLFIV